MKYRILITFTGVCLLSCNQNDKVNGLVKYYDGANKLAAAANFKNGILEGPTLRFYSNGNLRDSLLYADDRKYGFSYHFDSTGGLSSQEYYYFGLRVGPSISFREGRISNYDFIDFNKTMLCSFNYDSVGHCEYDSGFTINPNIADFWKDNHRFLDLSAYLPRPPGFSVRYALGIHFPGNHENELTEIKSDIPYWDTVLPSLPNDQNYYISIHLSSKKDSVDKLYIEVMHDTLPPRSKS